MTYYDETRVRVFICVRLRIKRAPFRVRARQSPHAFVSARVTYSDEIDVVR